MPINISTVPAKKRATTKSKKQEDAARVCKKNSDPDPNAPQPPSPDSDATDNDVEVEETAANVASTTEREDATSKATPTTTSSKKKKDKDDSYDRLEVNRLLSDLFPSTYMNQKLKSLESTMTTTTTSPQGRPRLLRPHSLPRPPTAPKRASQPAHNPLTHRQGLQCLQPASRPSWPRRCTPSRIPAPLSAWRPHGPSRFAWLRAVEMGPPSLSPCIQSQPVGV